MSSQLVVNINKKVCIRRRKQILAYVAGIEDLIGLKCGIRLLKKINADKWNEMYVIFLNNLNLFPKLNDRNILHTYANIPFIAEEYKFIKYFDKMINIIKKAAVIDNYIGIKITIEKLKFKYILTELIKINSNIYKYLMGTIFKILIKANAFRLIIYFKNLNEKNYIETYLYNKSINLHEYFNKYNKYFNIKELKLETICALNKHTISLYPDYWFINSVKNQMEKEIENYYKVLIIHNFCDEALHGNKEMMDKYLYIYLESVKNEYYEKRSNFMKKLFMLNRNSSEGCVFILKAIKTGLINPNKMNYHNICDMNNIKFEYNDELLKLYIYIFKNNYEIKGQHDSINRKELFINIIFKFNKKDPNNELIFELFKVLIEKKILILSKTKFKRIVKENFIKLVKYALEKYYDKVVHYIKSAYQMIEFSNHKEMKELLLFYKNRHI